MPLEEERPKASDVFRKTNFVFVDKVSFTEAFPTIASLRVEVERPGRESWNKRERIVLTESTAGEYVDCTNPLCYNGGVRLGGFLRDAVRDGRTEFEASALCQGYEGSPKGRRKYQKCVAHFRITGTITHKPESVDQAED